MSGVVGEMGACRDIVDSCTGSQAPNGAGHPGGPPIRRGDPLEQRAGLVRDGTLTPLGPQTFVVGGAGADPETGAARRLPRHRGCRIAPVGVRPARDPRGARSVAAGGHGPAPGTSNHADHRSCTRRRGSQPTTSSGRRDPVHLRRPHAVLPGRTRPGGPRRRGARCRRRCGSARQGERCMAVVAAREAAVPGPQRRDQPGGDPRRARRRSGHRELVGAGVPPGAEPRTGARPHLPAPIRARERSSPGSTSSTRRLRDRDRGDRGRRPQQPGSSGRRMPRGATSLGCSGSWSWSSPTSRWWAARMRSSTKSSGRCTPAGGSRPTTTRRACSSRTRTEGRRFLFGHDTDGLPFLNKNRVAVGRVGCARVSG